MSTTTIVLAEFDPAQHANSEHARLSAVPMSAWRRPTWLRFVESDDECSTYVDRDGEEVYLAHGTGLRLLPLDEYTPADLQRHYRIHFGATGDELLRLLREIALNPLDVDDLEFCGTCNDLEWEDDLNGTGSDGNVCNGCYEDYRQCHECSDMERSGNFVAWVDDWCCDYCTEQRFTWCDMCDEYVRDGYLSEHEAEVHGSNDCGCDVPSGRSFTVRNGEDVLANDVYLDVTLPAGEITEDGMDAIRAVVQQEGHRIFGLMTMEEKRAATIQSEHQRLYALGQRIEEIGNQWQGKRGNFTKRLSAFAYKEFGLKLAPEVISKVGNVAREHSNGADVTMAVTRELNMGAEDFYHDGSCWWTEYSESRCALKSNGGYGLRTFGPERQVLYSGTSSTYRSVEGRAWVMPLRVEGYNLVPTFDNMTADAFVVFNGYGDLEGYTPARIVAQMNGMSYRKIEFTCTPMYINNDAGYLVGAQDVLEQFPGFGLDLSEHSNLYYRESVRTADKELAHA